MARVLFWRPLFDIPTTYGYVWIGSILDRARAMGHSCLDLDKEKATRTNLESAITEFKPELFFGCSHGSTNAFSGQNKEIVLTACLDDEIMAGTQDYFVSCLMGAILGPDLVEKGALAVAAYTQEFVWLIHPDYQDNPLADPYAQAFKDAVVNPSIDLLAGAINWIPGFYNRSVEWFNRGVSEWFESTDPNAGQIVASLEHDRDSLIVLGEPTEIPPVTPPTKLTALKVAPFALGLTLLIFGTKLKK